MGLNVEHIEESYRKRSVQGLSIAYQEAFRTTSWSLSWIYDGRTQQERISLL